jgi:hypothetical protein
MSKITLQSVASVDNSLINAVNNNNAILTTAIDNTLSRDGTSPNQMNSVLDMNSHPIINIPYANMPNEPVALGQVTPNTTFIPVLGGDVTSGSFNGSLLPTTVAHITPSNIVTNSNLVQMAANTVKGNPTGSTANAQDVTPIVARSGSLLNIESITSAGDINYQILNTDRFVNLNTSFTAARTWTLPDVSTVNPGQIIYLWIWGANATFPWTLKGFGTQLISYDGLANSNTFTFPNQFFGAVMPNGGNWIIPHGATLFSSANPGVVPQSGGGTTNFLRADGTWAPTTTTGTPTVQRFTSGSATYTPTGGTIYIKVRIVGGGGGGAAAATNSGGTGGTTTFGTWTSIGGSGGAPAGGTPGAGGTGGVNGTGILIARVNGEPGQLATGAGSGMGGSTPFAGRGSTTATTGMAGNTNTGGGGGGGAGTPGGSGGGGSEYVEFFVNSPGATSYTVGGGGTGGTAGTQAGGAGGSGVIIIEEYPF